MLDWSEPASARTGCRQRILPADHRSRTPIKPASATIDRARRPRLALTTRG